MKIKNFKRKCIQLSLILILVGSLVTAVGFGAFGFNIDRLKETPVEETWYKTIHIDDKNFWYGIELGNDVHLLSIGYSE